jgi:hypothetical protein
VRFVGRDGQVKDLSLPQANNPMLEEALAFAHQVNSGEMEPSAVLRAKITAKILQQVRQQTGVVFPSDAR